MILAGKASAQPVEKFMQPKQLKTPKNKKIKKNLEWTLGDEIFEKQVEIGIKGKDKGPIWKSSD